MAVKRTPSTPRARKAPSEAEASPTRTASNLIALSPDQRLAFVERLTEEEASELQYLWPFWAREKQVAPLGDWVTWLILAGRGFGKALDVGTPIPTPTGWKSMGDLRVGDEVFDECGHPTLVTFVSEVMHEHPCYDVIFSDSSVITADANHEWLTWTHVARKAESRCGSSRRSARDADSRRSSRPRRSVVPSIMVNTESEAV